MKTGPLLAYINKYTTLTKDEEAYLESKISYRKYLKGQYLVQQGDVCKYECYVVSGCSKTSYIDDQGQEHIIMFSVEDWLTLIWEVPKLERFFRQVVEKAYIASQKRIVRNLSMTAKDRYLYFKEQYPEIEQRIPQYMVASYLGITKEFLSKIKSPLLTK